MVIVDADFPNEPEHGSALQNTRPARGSNRVEAELENSRICRRAGLKVRLGSIDINKMLRQPPN